MHYSTCIGSHTSNTEEMRNGNNEALMNEETCFSSRAAVNKVHPPEQHVQTSITVASSENCVSVLKLNCHMFNMKPNPRFCSERQRRQERENVNDVEGDK